MKLRGHSTELRPQETLRNVAQWNWRPAPADGGRDYGNSNVYATPPDLDTLVREIGQNSLDAKEEHSDKVALRFTLIELEKSSPEYAAFVDAISLSTLQQHVRAAGETKSKLGASLAAGLDAMDKLNRITLLRIDDFGTTGLIGSETPVDGQRSPFAALIRNNLDSSKVDSTAGGSFGLGKAVAWRCSAISTVLIGSKLAATCEHEGTFRVIGKAELTWHEEESGGPWAGPGWFSRVGPAAESLWLPLEDLKPLQLDRTTPLGYQNRTEDTGTSILIVAFQDPQDQGEPSPSKTCGALAKAAAMHFWPAIYNGHMAISVEHWLNSECLSREIVDPRQYVPEFCDILEKASRNDYATELRLPGDVIAVDIPLTVMSTRPDVKELRRFDTDVQAQCRLLVRLSPVKEAEVESGPQNLVDHVALVRGRQMVVRYLARRNLVVGGRPFHALLLAGTAAGSSDAHIAAEQFLRASEPPAHDDWRYEPDLKSQYKPGTGLRLKEFFQSISDRLRRVIRQPDGDGERGPAELRRLLSTDSRGGSPGTTSLPTLKNVKAALVNDCWQVQGQIDLKDPNKHWDVKPRLWLEVESGSPLSLAWRSLAASPAAVDSETSDVFRVLPGKRIVSFVGISESHVGAIRAADCRLRVDLKTSEISDA